MFDRYDLERDIEAAEFNDDPFDECAAENATVYWVGSNGDAPSAIYFSLQDAQKSGSVYIDGFDCGGAPNCEKYLLVDTTDDGENIYTDKF